MQADLVRAVLAVAPAAFWTLEDTNDHVAPSTGFPTDLSGNSNNTGSDTNRIEHNRQGPFVGSQSCFFAADSGDGTAARYTSTGAVTTATDNIGAELWFRIDARPTADNQPILSMTQVEFFIQQDLTIQGILQGVAFLTKSNRTVRLGRWTHFCGVREGGTWRYYIDGSLDTLNAGTNTPNAPGAITIHNIKVPGFVANVAIYNLARSITYDAVAARYRAGISTPSFERVAQLVVTPFQQRVIRFVS